MKDIFGSIFGQLDLESLRSLFETVRVNELVRVDSKGGRPSWVGTVTAIEAEQGTVLVMHPDGRRRRVPRDKVRKAKRDVT